MFQHIEPLKKIIDFSQNAHTRGISVVIAGAGGAALTRNGSLNVTTSSNRSSQIK
jgi:phosphoribosylcarboxyaminoimidazole (NCAIR) mutase